MVVDIHFPMGLRQHVTRVDTVQATTTVRVGNAQRRDQDEIIPQDNLAYLFHLIKLTNFYPSNFSTLDVSVLPERSFFLTPFYYNAAILLMH